MRKPKRDAFPRITLMHPSDDPKTGYIGTLPTCLAGMSLAETQPRASTRPCAARYPRTRWYIPSECPTQGMLKNHEQHAIHVLGWYIPSRSPTQGELKTMSRTLPTCIAGTPQR